MKKLIILLLLLIPIALFSQMKKLPLQHGVYSFVSYPDTSININAGLNHVIYVDSTETLIATWYGDIDSLRWTTNLSGVLNDPTNDTCTYTPIEAESGYISVSAYHYDELSYDSTYIRSIIDICDITTILINGTVTPDN